MRSFSKLDPMALVRGRPLSTTPDWNGPGGRLGCKHGAGRWTYEHHGDLPLYQFGCEGRQPIVLALSPAIFDGDVAAFGIAGLGKAAAKSVGIVRAGPR